jgi:site-specific DNA recombinase
VASEQRVLERLSGVLPLRHARTIELQWLLRRMIFEDYCLRFLGLGEICEKLNRDLDRFPPPIPNRKDDHGLAPTWSRSVLHAMLRNPKYTGFNVWGRHDKRKGRPLIRPHDQWIWSPNPTHEAIVSRELFEMVEEHSLGKRKAIKAGAVVRAQTSPARPSTGRIYALRGRVHCGMCGHRMDGSHQKGSNWYRCQYARRRSQAAAIHADHPQVLGIKEEKVLEAALDFLARRVFGPDRLRLLRNELADATASTWKTHAADLDHRENELRDIERSLRVQALRLEEHEDPAHPVVMLATERVEELSVRKSSVTAAIEALKAKRPAGHHPDEITAMLDTVPDLRKALKAADDQELADIFAAFDVTVSYDKASQKLDIAATITPELLPQNDPDRSQERSRVLEVAGAGFEPATFGL